MPRFDSQEVREQRLGRLPDITSVEGEQTPIRDGAVKPGGVTLPYALHTWTLSLTQLRRLRFPKTGNTDETNNEAARVVLAALALYAFALLRERGYWLRSRCELTPQTGGEGCPASLDLISVDGKPDCYAIPDVATAQKLLDDAKPGWEKRIIRLTPSAELIELVRRSDGLTTDTTPEEQEAAGVGNQS